MPRINTYTITKVSGMAFVGCNSQLCFFLMCAMCVLTGPYKQCIQHSQRTNVIVVCFSSLQKSEVMYREHTVSQKESTDVLGYIFVCVQSSEARNGIEQKLSYSAKHSCRSIARNSKNNVFILQFSISKVRLKIMATYDISVPKVGIRRYILGQCVTYI